MVIYPRPGCPGWAVGRSIYPTDNGSVMDDDQFRCLMPLLRFNFGFLDCEMRFGWLHGLSEEL